MNKNDLPLISIIVPVFNVEQYLEKCVNSLLSQTYKNIEILLIDDGSTDSSPSICDFFSKNTPDKIKTIHKTNGGLSSARNYGIDNAMGEFLVFIDSDDWVEPGLCERLYNAKKETGSKIVGCVFNLIYEKNTKYEDLFGESLVTFSREKGLEVLFNLKGYSACGKLFDATLFKNIKFPIGKVDEDFATMYKLFADSNTITFVPERLYNYYIRKGSIVRSDFNERDLDFVNNVDDAINYLLKNSYNRRIIKLAKCCLIRRSFYILRKAYSSKNKVDKKNIKKLKRIIRKGIHLVVFEPYFHFKEKMAIIIIFCSKKLYFKLAKHTY